MPGDALARISSPGTRPNDKVLLCGENWAHEFADCLRIIGAVAIHEYDDVAAGGGQRPCQAGLSIAQPGGNDFCSGAPGSLNSRVPAAAICHDDAAYEMARNTRDDFGNGPLFIERGYYHGSLRSIGCEMHVGPRGQCSDHGAKEDTSRGATIHHNPRSLL